MARNLEFNEEEAVQKAMEVFWKKGYSGTSLRDLTEAMQINSSSLYNTIGDKHALFVKCIKHYTETRMKEIKKRADNAASPLNAIINFINDAVSVVINGDSCMAIKAAFEIAADDKVIQDILKADDNFTHAFLSGLIKAARERGELSRTGDAEMLTDYLITIYTGWYESYIIHQDPIRIKKMGEYVISQLSA